MDRSPELLFHFEAQQGARFDRLLQTHLVVGPAKHFVEYNAEVRPALRARACSSCCAAGALAVRCLARAARSRPLRLAAPA